MHALMIPHEKMSLVSLSQILFFTSAIVSHLLAYCWKRNKVAKKYLILSYIITVLSMWLISVAGNKESSERWRDSAFEGVIMSMVVTKEHAVREYEIKQGNKIITFRDSLGKLYHLQIGDYVKKEAGKDTMEVKSR